MNEEMLHAYVDGELSPEEAARVERAAAADPAVGERLRELVAVDDAIGLLPGLEGASPGFASEVVRRAGAHRRGRLLRWAAPIAAAAAVVAAAVLLVQHEPAPPADAFDEADYVDYRWEVDTDTFGSLAVTDLESEILKELRSS